LAPQTTDVGVEELAKEWNRSTDSLAGHPALQLPNDVYLVELDDTFYGAMAPADRQSTLRWIEAAETLSASGLRQMNMLVAQPVQAAFGGIGLTAAKETMADPIVATRRYFDRVELCFKDLDETIRNGTSKTAKACQRWFSASADQIDMLPSRNVNQEVLELGGSVAESFREISLSLVAADASNSSQSKVLDANRSGGYYYYPYAYGYGYRRPNASKLKAAIRAQNYAAVQVQTTAIMNRVKNDLGDIRRNVKFEK
jgi:hypothetical protein